MGLVRELGLYLNTETVAQEVTCSRLYSLHKMELEASSVHLQTQLLYSLCVHFGSRLAQSPYKFPSMQFQNLSTKQRGKEILSAPRLSYSGRPRGLGRAVFPLLLSSIYGVLAKLSLSLMSKEPSEYHLGSSSCVTMPSGSRPACLCTLSSLPHFHAPLGDTCTACCPMNAPRALFSSTFLCWKSTCLTRPFCLDTFFSLRIYPGTASDASRPAGSHPRPLPHPA